MDVSDNRKWGGLVEKAPEQDNGESLMGQSFAARSIGFGIGYHKRP